MPTEVGKSRREHVETYIEDQLARWKPTTANNRRRSLAQLFGYLEDQGEIRTPPMAKMKPPKVPEQQVPVLSDDELRALLKACDGRQFEERRDPPPAQRVPQLTPRACCPGFVPTSGAGATQIDPLTVTRLSFPVKTRGHPVDAGGARWGVEGLSSNRPPRGPTLAAFRAAGRGHTTLALAL